MDLFDAMVGGVRGDLGAVGFGGVLSWGGWRGGGGDEGRKGGGKR